MPESLVCPTHGPIRTELHLGDLHRIRLVVLPVPVLTSIVLTADALGRRRGAPEPWRRAVRAAVPDGAREAFAPLLQPGPTSLPDCLVPFTSTDRLSMASAVERLDAVLPGNLLEELTEIEQSATLPASWRPVIDDPRRWLRSYTATVKDAWAGIAGIWRLAGGLLGREQERIGRAVVSGCLDVVLSSLPNCRYADGWLSFDDPHPTSHRLAERTLVLAPMLTGDRSVATNFSLPGVVWIGYPLPGIGRLLDGAGGTAMPPARLLSALLGPTRALVLHVLREPLTMGELAAVLRCAPSAATYHCGRLAAAGLVTRERYGREVRARRSVRGDELVDVLGRP